jgi:hypothetical protein
VALRQKPIDRPDRVAVAAMRSGLRDPKRGVNASIRRFPGTISSRVRFGL